MSQDKSRSSQGHAKTSPKFLIPDPQGEAETCFQKAIEISQKQ